MVSKTKGRVAFAIAAILVAACALAAPSAQPPGMYADTVVTAAPADFMPAPAVFEVSPVAARFDSGVGVPVAAYLDVKSGELYVLSVRRMRPPAQPATRSPVRYTAVRGADPPLI